MRVGREQLNNKRDPCVADKSLSIAFLAAAKWAERKNRGSHKASVYRSVAGEIYTLYRNIVKSRGTVVNFLPLLSPRLTKPSPPSPPLSPLGPYSDNTAPAYPDSDCSHLTDIRYWSAWRTHKVHLESPSRKKPLPPSPYRRRLSRGHWQPLCHRSSLQKPANAVV